MNTTQVVYFTPAETAAEMRKALKAAFPGVKFSVRTRTYAGGSSIDVSYFRGPASDKVSRLADRFQGRDFDGMTDSSTYRGSMLLCDESGEVREVHYGSSFVNVRRDFDENRYAATSPAYDAIEAAIVSRYADGHAPNDVRAWRFSQSLDWNPGESVESFAARVADAYFA